MNGPNMFSIYLLCARTQLQGRFCTFVGVTDTNEFVFKPLSSSEPFHVHCYNFVKKVITRVEIQAMGAFERDSRVLTFLNHVENVKLM